MAIPKSLNDFTVEQFQKWHEIINTVYEDPTDRPIALAAALLGKSIEELDNMPGYELIPILKQIKDIDEKIDQKVRTVIRVNKKWYRAIVNHKQLRELMSQNQFEAADTYAKDPIQNMDKLLALMYSPIKLFKKPRLSLAQESTANDFKKAKIKDVYGAVFFSSVVYKKYEPVLADFLNQSTQTINEHLQEIAQDKDFLKAMDGIISENGL